MLISTRSMRCSRIGLGLALALLMGCSNQMIGLPELRSSTDDGQGPMVPGCQNVSSDARTEEFNTRFYGSTWLSASLEGASQAIAGTLPILSEVVGVGGSGTADAPPGVAVTMQEGILPYCRIFTSSPDQLFAVARDEIERALPQFGYDVTCGGRIGRVCETNYVFRSHSAAQWADRFRVRVVEIDANYSYLLVDRRLFISRDGEIYNQAVPVGSHELYIITRVANRL